MDERRRPVDLEPPSVRDFALKPTDAPSLSTTDADTQSGFISATEGAAAVDDVVYDERQKPLWVLDDAVSPNADVAAVAETEDTERHLENVDVAENDSIHSSQLSEGPTNVRYYTGWRRADFVSKSKTTGRKYARVAAVYVEGLESRVSVLEEELHELLIEMGTRARDKDAAVEDMLLPDSLCSKPFEVDIMRVELKEWKTRGHESMRAEKACIYLGIATNSGPLRGGSVKPLVHNNDTTQGQSVNINLDNLPGSIAEVSQPRATSLARLAFSSPWPSIVIELLTGESVDPLIVWIPPFKHFVMYEKQIRMFVQLLGEKNADFLEAKDLIRTLKEITEQVVRRLDPTRGDFAYSEATIVSMLDKRESFDTHLKKARHGLAEHQDSKEELTGDVEEGTGERAEATVVQSEGVEEDLKISSSAAVFEGTSSRSPHRQACSCLRDAKHHLQLLLTVLDENLGDLLILRKAISEKSLKKIEFEHLWHLFQPGILVVTAKSPRQAYRVLHVSGGRSLMTTQPLLDGRGLADQQDTSRKSKRSPFRLDCIKFDFDGEVFGPLQETLSLVEYNDEKKITELDVYPMEFAEDQTALNRVLIERGGQFAGFHKFKHKRYAGLSLEDPQEEVI